MFASRPTKLASCLQKLKTPGTVPVLLLQQYCQRRPTHVLQQLLVQQQADHLLAGHHRAPRPGRPPVPNSVPKVAPGAEHLSDWRAGSGARGRGTRGGGRSDICAAHGIKIKTDVE
jgi:hypothetical protein